MRYDIDRLTDRYGLGYEIVCHRVSTLQRPHGVLPLSFKDKHLGDPAYREQISGYYGTGGPGH